MQLGQTHLPALLSQMRSLISSGWDPEEPTYFFSVSLDMFAVLSNHQTLHVIPCSHALIGLCQPWLKRCSPHINWSTGNMVSWSSFCHSSCRQSALALTVLAPVLSLLTELLDLTSAPSVCCEKREVLSKQHSLALPPRWPYGCFSLTFFP